MDETPAAETPDQGADTPPAATEPPQTDAPADQTQPDPDDSQAVDVAAITAERDQLAVQVQRLTVAAETGIPADLLTATTEPELRRQAEKLTEYAANHRRVPDFGAGKRGEHIAAPDADPVRSALGKGRR